MLTRELLNKFDSFSNSSLSKMGRTHTFDKDMSEEDIFKLFAIYTAFILAFIVVIWKRRLSMAKSFFSLFVKTGTTPFVYRLDKVLQSIDEKLGDGYRGNCAFLPVTKNTDLAWTEDSKHTWCRPQNGESVLRSIGWTRKDLKDSLIDITTVEEIIGENITPETSLVLKDNADFMILLGVLKWVPFSIRTEVIYKMIKCWESKLGWYEYEAVLKYPDGIRWIRIFLRTDDDSISHNKYDKKLPLCGFRLAVKYSFLECEGELLEKAILTDLKED